ncbi:DUF192 domain-containing protein [Brucella sp. 10RB9214]|uniref:DUF192 domain-containing protein n=1 Tax=unclassified Brucella TaxID=2632610 RepID=UPI000972B458|nr:MULTISPECIES: DUF192 domain-containing protein [unclassified Brucella]APY14626.1 hypothetical protein BKD02_10455 [Brucella sp. 09RB8910]MRN45746.1 DUF192 domain-containing protein [Brucella sp. 10RB9212]MRN48392.1 DUF192 domain-containing protein [Brucella sp. 10RB9214]
MGRIFLALAFMFVAFVARADEAQPMRLPVDKEQLTFITSTGNKINFALEVADTDEARVRGLMWRTDFPKDRAMIFILGEMRRIVMWMQNTPLPLDMVFLDDKGRVVAIHENAVPFSENLISSEVPAAYAIELLAGTVKRTGIKVGDRAIHRVICGECRS